MLLRKLTTYSENIWVLRHLGDEMLATRLLCQHCTTNGQGITLRSSSGKDDFGRGSGEQPGHLLPGCLDRRMRRVCIEVCARWIPKVDGEIGHHRFDDLWVNRCRPVVIEIDRTLRQSWMNKRFVHTATSFSSGKETGKPRRRHSSTPTSRRRAANPWERNRFTASSANTQYGPRQYATIS